MKTVKEEIFQSISTKQAILDNPDLISKIEKAAQIMTDAYRNGHSALLAGNGGSAADAQHLAGELVNKFYFDRPGIPAHSLSTDTSVMTAIGNDIGYKYLFSRQIEAQGSKGDVFIGISTSGNSENIIEAFHFLPSVKEDGFYAGIHFAACPVQSGHLAVCPRKRQGEEKVPGPAPRLPARCLDGLDIAPDFQQTFRGDFQRLGSRVINLIPQFLFEGPDHFPVFRFHLAQSQRKR